MYGLSILNTFFQVTTTSASEKKNKKKKKKEMEATWLETDYAKAIPKDIRLMVLPYIRLPNYERYCRSYGSPCYACWEHTRRWVCLQTRLGRSWIPTCLNCRFPTASEVVYFGAIPPLREEGDKVVQPVPGRTSRVRRVVRVSGALGLMDE